MGDTVVGEMLGIARCAPTFLELLTVVQTGNVLSQRCFSVTMAVVAADVGAHGHVVGRCATPRLQRSQHRCWTCDGVVVDRLRCFCLVLNSS